MIRNRAVMVELREPCRFGAGGITPSRARGAKTGPSHPMSIRIPPNCGVTP